MSGCLTLAVRTDRDRIAASGGEINVEIRVHAPHDAGFERTPLNVVAILDDSASMAGHKLDCAKRALDYLIEQMARGDLFALCLFDTDAHRTQGSTSTCNKDAFKDNLAWIQAGGKTDLGDGLITGMRMLGDFAASQYVSKAFLISDGRPDIGHRDPRTLAAFVDACHKEGIILSTLAIGDDADFDFMATLANAGGGQCHRILGPDDIPGALDDELAPPLRIAARRLQLQVVVAPGVRIKQVIGYPPQTFFTRLAIIGLPDIYYDEDKSPLLTLVVDAPPGDGLLAKLALGYEMADAGTGQQMATASVMVATAAAGEMPGEP